MANARRAARTAAIAIVVLLGIVVSGCSGSDGDATKATTTQRPTTTGATTSSSSPPTTSTTAPAPDELSTALWPFVASPTRYQDPVAAARGFAVDFVGFVDPIVGEFQAGDARSGEVTVRRSDPGPVTTVFVRQLGSDGTWWVLGSTTPNIVLTSPAARSTIVSPVKLQGSSDAFEATVNVEVREDGSAQPLGEDIVMGGANGQLEPFEKSMVFVRASAAAGALVLFTRSPEDGRIVEATVVRVSF